MQIRTYEKHYATHNGARCSHSAFAAVHHPFYPLPYRSALRSNASG
jgi:hypothetical protein